MRTNEDAGCSSLQTKVILILTVPVFFLELLLLCTQPRDCPPEQSEGTQNLRTEIFHYVQNDKSVGGVILYNKPTFSTSAFWPFVALCSPFSLLGILGPKGQQNKHLNEIITDFDTENYIANWQFFITEPHRVPRN